MLIKTTPRIGSYSVLTMASMIEDIGRLNVPWNLSVYVGLVLPIRGSTEAVFYGLIVLATIIHSF